MIIYIWQGDDNVPIPQPSLRWDRAWSLFLPDSLGSVPPGWRGAQELIPMTAWAWRMLGTVAGALRVRDAKPIWFVTPPLTATAQEYVVRTASCWADEVYTVADAYYPEEHSNNLWLPPVVETSQPPEESTLDAHLALSNAEATMRFFTAHLGFGRAAIGVDVIAPGVTKGRLHSHSAVDEYYVVLAGHGTLRMGLHTVAVGPGSLIGKPTGPDLTSHILADHGEPMTILDIEVWPQAGYEAKDLVHYADFGELVLRGTGWRAMIPVEALQTVDEVLNQYEAGYWRKSDGTWEPKDIPGAPQRHPASGTGSPGDADGR